MVKTKGRTVRGSWVVVLSAMAVGCGSSSKPVAATRPAAAAELRWDPDATYVKGDGVDEAVQRWMKERHIPGLALAVVMDGEVKKVKGYGLADVAKWERVRPETEFFIASLSKPFVAIGVMMLVEEGEVGLDNFVTDYFPGAPREWRQVTVRDLLAHTSGVPDYINQDIVIHDAMLFGIPLTGHYLNGHFTRDMKGDWLLKIIEEQPLLFRPGTRYAYSNTNYVLLGMIIRQVTGKTYAAFLRERIFDPLRMTHTRFYGDGSPRELAVGYRWNDGRLVEDRSRLTIDGLGPASGGMITNVTDLVKWDAALSAGTLVKAETLRAMWTPRVLPGGEASSYGLGFGLGEMPGGGSVVGHAGAFAGYSSFFFRYGGRLTLIYLTNRHLLDTTTTPRELWDAYVPLAATKTAGN